ncbi:DNA binding protein [Acinetobacter phage vB_AbaM_Konradin]|uniref:Putative endonuclease V n=1 Tax=Acinetobacter phage vB_AbaM_Konradin TaxID=2666257 RepID=A0A650EUM3_9CAUD|nr:DNA binding protein [Acinetobacter phage vB_AbaM_Konradin]QGT53796.1 putative endonuclease V [Acinetobacter phage vB_AbaM_Konradin]
MNIFHFDANPAKSAQYHCDKHVVKMCVEYCQILSTVSRLNGIESDILYCATHKNHPCVVWAMQSRQNYEFLLDLVIELFGEYTYRYGKVHASSRLIPALIDNIDKIPLGANKLTPFVAVMPGRILRTNAIAEYRTLYKNEKAHMAKWTGRDIPFFLK